MFLTTIRMELKRGCYSFRKYLHFLFLKVSHFFRLLSWNLGFQANIYLRRNPSFLFGISREAFPIPYIPSASSQILFTQSSPYGIERSENIHSSSFGLGSVLVSGIIPTGPLDRGHLYRFQVASAGPFNWRQITGNSCEAGNKRLE